MRYKLKKSGGSQQKSPRKKKNNNSYIATHLKTEQNTTLENLADSKVLYVSKEGCMYIYLCIKMHINSTLTCG